MTKLTVEEIKRFKTIETELKKLKSGKWTLSVEGQDHTGGDTVISRENDDDLYLNPKTQVEVWEFIANSKANIEFLITLVQKLATNNQNDAK